MRKIDAVLKERPTFIEDVVESISSDFVLNVLRQVADTPAPSGTSSLTRGPVVQAWCESQGLLEAGADFQRDAYDSGGDVLRFGTGGIGMIAHLDEVSYLFRNRVGPGLSQITPYCYHLAEAPAPARILRFSGDGSWQILCDAEVSFDGSAHFVSHPEEIELQPADRIVLASPIAHDKQSGRVTGSLDNAAGVAATLTASAVMLKFGIPFSTYLTDEEEGPSGESSQTISRGAARLLRRVDPAPLTVAVDIHGLNAADLESSSNHQVAWGASLAEYSSGGRGSVARPDILAALIEGFNLVTDRGIKVQSNLGGHVARSDDVMAMLHSNRVVVLGYPGMNRHFDQGLPTVNLNDVVHLARALVLVGAMVAPHPAKGLS